MTAIEGSDLIAAIAGLIGHTGAEQFQVRYHDDEQPVVWVSVATYADGRAEADAALTPDQAAWRLAERLVDGGRCTLCSRPTALVENEDDLTSGVDFLCQYRYRSGM
jgi:hypothetical protein